MSKITKKNYENATFFVRQNTHGLEQQMNANQENFTLPLVVMVETFRRSASEDPRW